MCFFFTKSNERSSKCLNIGDKLKIIKEVEKGVKRKNDIAADFNISANTLSSILKNKDKIIIIQHNMYAMNKYTFFSIIKKFYFKFYLCFKFPS